MTYAVGVWFILVKTVKESLMHIIVPYDFYCY